MYLHITNQHHYMPTLTNAATILLVKDVPHSANWYKDKLGFRIVKFYGTHAAFIERDGFTIMLQGTPDPGRIIPNWKMADKTSNIYFWVDDVETLYKEFIASGATIDFTLYATPWGTKEFGINDPDEYDISFGQVLDPASNIFTRNTSNDK
jgi:catechol 2,3-dioxygenase-like lactoylglutathione lyase family enzyme